jgi:hypothetical protein
VRARDNRRLAGSVNVDSALSEALPAAPRWDYGIGYRPSKVHDETVHWVEVHQATDAEIRAMEAKLAWLQDWLVHAAPELARMDRRFIWVSSGRTRITPTAPGLRRLAKKGCRNVGRVYTIR